ncbi:hypothetical protein MTR_1g076260 [Medicago truncatula]|uniref:Uncharacterized protein n=1 Tax=Medicago truncatula TaxID=3880 RepID=A0A072VXG6_MEDTR|nr:hypothetical protein MTR_1g076260 [Medicago truncatula]
MRATHLRNTYIYYALNTLHNSQNKLDCQTSQDEQNPYLEPHNFTSFVVFKVNNYTYFELESLKVFLRWTHVIRASIIHDINLLGFPICHHKRLPTRIIFL